MMKRNNIETLLLQTRITVAAYPRACIPECYHRIRTMRKSCLICKHYTAQCDLRKEKRFIVPLEHGTCSLRKEVANCRSFEKIDELRGRNMTSLEKVYAHHYTNAFLHKVFRWFYNNSAVDVFPLRRSPESIARMIALYQKLAKTFTPSNNRR